ncbi:MAG: sigma 54-interacting transcriptional regulator [Thermodesulfobacteriota bacterium]
MGARGTLGAELGRLRRLIENLPGVGVFARGEDGAFVWFNEQLLAMTGYGADELLGSPKNLLSRFFPEDEYRAEVLAGLRSLSGNYREYEVRLACKDGSRIRVALSNISDLIPVPGWTSWGIAVDVTARHRSQEDLERQVAERTRKLLQKVAAHKRAEDMLLRANEERERYRMHLEAVFQSIPEGIVTVDRELRVLSCNRAANDFCSLSGSQTTGRRIGDVLPGRLRPCLHLLREAIEAGRTTRNYRLDNAGSDDESAFEINCSPLRDTSGELKGALLILRDVSDVQRLEQALIGRSGFHGLVGANKRMQELFELAGRLAEVETTVLIQGESGTGKELLAEALHQAGPRARGPLVKVNCAALLETLLESELFGHAKGAYTGAYRERQGRIEKARGGTLLLDEIGDISPRIQAKILRFLESKEYERVGESRSRRADVRLLASTNADLASLVREGTFRQDLYYRLKVMVMQVPPLRERTDDIPRLAEHFLGLHAHQFSITKPDISPRAMRRLLNYSWPGNVRELKHAMEHACLLCGNRIIEPDHLPDELRLAPDGQGNSLSSRRGEVDEAALRDALARTDWNKAKAARLLGVSRGTLYTRLRSFGIKT